MKCLCLEESSLAGAASKPSGMLCQLHYALTLHVSPHFLMCSPILRTSHPAFEAPFVPISVLPPPSTLTLQSGGCRSTPGSQQCHRLYQTIRVLMGYYKAGKQAEHGPGEPKAGCSPCISHVHVFQP